MVIPNWLDKYLDEDDLLTIEGEIARIEKQTQAEIVPVVVRSSSAYRQSQVTLVLLSLVIFMMIWEVFGSFMSWDFLERSILLLLVGVGTIFLVIPRLAQLPKIRRLLTVRSEEMEQAFKRAQIEFYQNNLHQTQDKVGVLIFISLLEHAVVVLADQTICDVLPPQTWQQVVDEVVKGLRSHEMGVGIKKGLMVCSDLLIKNFPVKSDDVDELPNKLIIKE